MVDLVQRLLAGVPMTLLVTVSAFLVGAVLGLPLSLLRQSPRFVLRWPARAYLDLVRGVPPLVWVFIIFFGLSTGSFQFGPVTASVAALGLMSSAYIAEIYRGGFVSVGAGQSAAGKALGMTGIDRLRYILLPQVLRVSLPALATFFVGLLKDSAFASTIGVREITMLATQYAQSTGASFAPFLAVALLYIVLSIPVAFLARVTYARLRQQGAR